MGVLSRLEQWIAPPVQELSGDEGVPVQHRLDYLPVAVSVYFHCCEAGFVVPSGNALCARVRDVSESAYSQLYKACSEHGLLNKWGLEAKSAPWDLFT